MSDEEKPWSEEDQQWLDSVEPPALRAIAKRHGRPLFAIVWQAGMIGEALNRAHAHTQGVSKWGMRRDVQGLTASIQVLAGAMDLLCKAALSGYGRTIGQFTECKQDIERCMALGQVAQAANDRVSKGGIILDS